MSTTPAVTPPSAAPSADLHTHIRTILARVRTAPAQQLASAYAEATDDLLALLATDDAARAIPQATSPWPMDPPILGTIPSAWARNAAAFVTLLSWYPALWLCDGDLKYLTMRIDTRDGGFTLADRDGQRIDLARVLRAVHQSRERFGDAQLGSPLRDEASEAGGGAPP
jgi:hypothetical protein